MSGSRYSNRQTTPKRGNSGDATLPQSITFRKVSTHIDKDNIAESYVIAEPLAHELELKPGRIETNPETGEVKLVGRVVIPVERDPETGAVLTQVRVKCRAVDPAIPRANRPRVIHELSSKKGTGAGIQDRSEKMDGGLFYVDTAWINKDKEGNIIVNARGTHGIGNAPDFVVDEETGTPFKKAIFPNSYTMMLPNMAMQKVMNEATKYGSFNEFQEAVTAVLQSGKARPSAIMIDAENAVVCDPSLETSMLDQVVSLGMQHDAAAREEFWGVQSAFNLVLRSETDFGPNGRMGITIRVGQKKVAEGEYAPHDEASLKEMFLKQVNYVYRDNSILLDVLEGRVEGWQVEFQPGYAPMVSDSYNPYKLNGTRYPYDQSIQSLIYDLDEASKVYEVLDDAGFYETDAQLTRAGDGIETKYYYMLAGLEALKSNRAIMGGDIPSPHTSPEHLENIAVMSVMNAEAHKKYAARKVATFSITNVVKGDEKTIMRWNEAKSRINRAPSHEAENLSETPENVF